jgi:hypothetical protein
MGPTNDHERAIAAIVDRFSLDGKLSPAAIEGVIAVLDFPMNRSDSEFLLSYIRWRADHPIAKERA